MANKKYDIFISYRRDGGYETAKHLFDLLTIDGYSVSFDIDTLRQGDFDKSLLSRIEECTDFILVLDEHVFDRTLDPNFDKSKDSLRNELAYALKLRKNIIPIKLKGFEFPNDLPDDIADVTTKNGPSYACEYFDSFYTHLKDFFSTSIKPSFDIFISYSHQDFDEVNTMVSRIKDALPWINMWFDVNELKGGEDYLKQTIAAIDNSTITLFAISENESSWARREISYAQYKSKNIIPILLKGVKLKGWSLFQFGGVDCIDINIDSQWNKLVQYLSDLFPEHNEINIDNENISEILPIAHQEDPPSQFYLGWCYENGQDVVQDYKEAVRWYRMAAENGHIGALNNLGECYYNGKGVKQDYMEAVKLYRMAAEQDNPRAQYNLGCCYYFGQGVEQDFTSAVFWYSKAASKGYASAQNSLGICYTQGDGVEQNYAEATKYYRKAAEQDHATALNNLGWCYEHGMGVEQNYTQARNCYRKAAEKGHAVIQFFEEDAKSNKYDVFISCKSEDYRYAEVIYDFLTSNNTSVFLASKELHALGKSEYRKAITKAIDSSYHMIVFGSSLDNIMSNWVSYEWDMFYNAILDGSKKGQIITILKGVEHRELGIDLRRCQSLTFENFKENILDYAKTPKS